MTPVIGAALAVVAAGCLILFFVIAQRAARDDSRGRAVAPVAPGGRGGAITFQDPSDDSGGDRGGGDSTGNPFDRIVPIPGAGEPGQPDTVEDPSTASTQEAPSGSTTQRLDRLFAGPSVGSQEPNSDGDGDDGDGDDGDGGEPREPYSGGGPPGPGQIIDEPGVTTAGGDTDGKGADWTLQAPREEAKRENKGLDDPTIALLGEDPDALTTERDPSGDTVGRKTTKQKHSTGRAKDKATKPRPAGKRHPKGEAKGHDKPPPPRGKAKGHHKPPPPRGKAKGHHKPPPPRGKAKGHHKPPPPRGKAEGHPKPRPAPSSSSRPPKRNHGEARHAKPERTPGKSRAHAKPKPTPQSGGSSGGHGAKKPKPAKGSRK
jgi:hypothetical protein